MLIQNIENICALHGISVSALEKTLGFGNSTISKWAKCSPTVEKLAMVANYFGVTVDELLNGGMLPETWDTQNEYMQGGALMKTIATMDLNECAAYLREHGLSISNESLAAGLEQRVYPFGVCICGGKRRIFQIYTRLVNEWIAEREVEA